MIRLSREDSLLQLTCRPFLQSHEDERLRLLSTQEVNWAYVTWRAENNRTIPVLEYHLRRLGVLHTLPTDVKTYIQRWTAMSRVRSVLEFRNLVTILDALEQAGVACFLVKGPDLALLYYPDPMLRPMTDVDIMIRPSDAALVQKLMFELGYRHGIFNPLNGHWTNEEKPIGRDTFRDTYALPVFVRIEKLESPFPASDLPAKLRYRHVKAFIDSRHMPIFIDVHFNLSVGIDEEDIWSGLQLANALGRVVRVHSPTGAVWFLAARLYHEAFLYNSLRLLMFGDLQAVLHRQLANVNWAEVAAIAYKYEMRPALFYVLSQVRLICDVDIPTAFLELIRPDQTEIPLQHDWGDIIPKLFSIPIVHEVALA
jgi:Uncharacterised nucleotidyltransferase